MEASGTQEDSVTPIGPKIKQGNPLFDDMEDVPDVIPPPKHIDDVKYVTTENDPSWEIDFTEKFE